MNSPRLVRIGLCLLLLVATRPVGAFGATEARFTFENVDIKIVVAEVARRTGTTILFDPARVKGTITIVGPEDVTPAQALELLRSALALHGYAVVRRPDSLWIVPAQDISRPDFVVRVVRLTYADAGDVAVTLSWVAPPGVRIVPHYATNSVVIAGHSTDVEQMLDAIRPR